MDDIRLVDVTKKNWDDICALYPGKDGRMFVASNSYSIAQSVYEDGWVIKGISLGDELIGFTMYGFSEELNAYEICRFMLDERYQLKGYGSKALRVIIDEMFKAYHCDRLYLSTSPDNARGQHVYTRAGFKPTGETCGEGEDIEDIYCLMKEA